MGKKGSIEGWWSFLLAVVIEPIWELVTTGVIVTILYVGTWWRDNFASEEWKKKLELKGVLPHWHPAWWVCLGLVVCLFFILKAAHDLWQAEREQSLRLTEKKTLPATAPEVMLGPDRTPDMGLPFGLLMSNASNEHLHDIQFETVHLDIRDDVTVVWRPTNMPLLEGRAQQTIKPLLLIDKGNTPSSIEEGIGALIEILAAQFDPRRPMTPLPPITFTCRDRANNKYRVVFRLIFHHLLNKLSIDSPTRELISE